MAQTLSTNTQARVVVVLDLLCQLVRELLVVAPKSHTDVLAISKQKNSRLFLGVAPIEFIPPS
jgi:hypothetical protein